ncbi:MAG: cupredoxin domain-containing protein [Nitrosopumilus sp.]|nr:cupredoxin domain-containing protein [Nitrosopumilus sp.]
MDNDFAFGEIFQVTISEGATASNIGEPYSPQTINVPINSSVIWTNNDTTPHTVTSVNGTSGSKPFDSGLMSQGETFKVAYNKTGTYSYQCTLHPFMAGNVIVGANATASEPITTNQVIDVNDSKPIIVEGDDPITSDAVETNGVYLWESNGTNNPTLNLLPNNQYSFIIRSLPTDPAEHEFKIVLPDGEDIVEAAEVEEGEQTAVAFNPTEPGRLKYYCEYHPQSMVGIINIVDR